VSGKQTIKQGSDEQRITITGMVRSDDVTADNTVLSSYVSNSEIKIDGKGPLAGKQRQGILSSLFNFLF
jgi:flagellar L-ring protein precursor FlgH